MHIIYKSLNKSLNQLNKKHIMAQYWTDYESELFVRLTQTKSIEERNKIFVELYPKFLQISKYLYTNSFYLTQSKVAAEDYIINTVHNCFEIFINCKPDPNANIFSYVTQILKNNYLQQLKKSTEVTKSPTSVFDAAHSRYNKYSVDDPIYVIKQNNLYSGNREEILEKAFQFYVKLLHKIIDINFNNYLMKLKKTKGSGFRTIKSYQNETRTKIYYKYLITLIYTNKFKEQLFKVIKLPQRFSKKFIYEWFLNEYKSNNNRGYKTIHNYLTKNISLAVTREQKSKYFKENFPNEYKQFQEIMSYFNDNYFKHDLISLQTIKNYQPKN